MIDLVTALAEKPPASAGYRGSNLMHWRTGVIQARLRLDWQMGVQTCWPLFLRMLAGKWRRRTGFERNIPKGKLKNGDQRPAPKTRPARIGE